MRLFNFFKNGYTPMYAPQNNRKRTRGRNYKYVKDSNGRIRKIWPKMEQV